MYVKDTSNSGDRNWKVGMMHVLLHWFGWQCIATCNHAAMRQKCNGHQHSFRLFLVARDPYERHENNAQGSFRSSCLSVVCCISIIWPNPTITNGAEPIAHQMHAPLRIVDHKHGQSNLHHHHRHLLLAIKDFYIPLPCFKYDCNTTVRLGTVSPISGCSYADQLTVNRLVEVGAGCYVIPAVLPVCSSQNACLHAMRWIFNNQSLFEVRSCACMREWVGRCEAEIKARIITASSNWWVSIHSFIGLKDDDNNHNECAGEWVIAVVD